MIGPKSLGELVLGANYDSGFLAYRWVLCLVDTAMMHYPNNF